MSKKFILHSLKHHGYHPLEDDGGNIIGEGAMGRLTEDSVYLKAYAKYPGDKRPGDLKVGECIKGVEYRLSSEKGIYDVYRVR